MIVEIEEKLQLLYPGWKIYGPYPRKSDGRNQLVLAKEDKRITKLYAKFILEVKLGRILSKEETVDHIDRNKFNDTIDNVRLLSRSENASIAVSRLVITDVECVWCGNTFTPTSRNLGLQKKTNNTDATTSGPFCSKKCIGKYGAHVQNGGQLFTEKEDNRVYYSLQ